MQPTVITRCPRKEQSNPMLGCLATGAGGPKTVAFRITGRAQSGSSIGLHSAHKPINVLTLGVIQA